MERKKKDKRVVLLVLPLIVTPLLALGFYGLGGGRNGNGKLVPSGINASLPDASFKGEEPKGKMGFYANGEKDTVGMSASNKLAGNSGFGISSAKDRTVEIDEKLAALHREIVGPDLSSNAGNGGGIGGVKPTKQKDAGMKADVDRLEMLMNSMKADKGEDAEMQQMNAVLEKILDIQNPARVQAKLTGGALGVAVGAGLDKEFVAVPAALGDNARAVQGSTVRLVLLDSLMVKNVVVPKGHSVFGLCRIVNQRLLLEVKHIRLGELIIPVELTMYGLDGMPGLAAPRAIVSEVASAGAVDALSGISVYGMEGVAGQAAGAGLDAAKSLFARKVRVLKVKLRAGEKVLLRVGRN